MSNKCLKKCVCICLIMAFMLTNFPVGIFKGSGADYAFAESKTPLSIKYDAFDTTSQIQLNGNSLTAEYNGSQVLRLNEAKIHQKSSVFTKNKIYLRNDNSFSTYFVFRSSDPHNPWRSGMHGGDGFTFTIQTMGSNALGTNSYRFVADNMEPSVSIEFDTYENDRTGTNDDDDNHVGIDLNGSAESIAKTSFPNTIVNGNEYHVWVDYDGTAQTMEIRVSDNSSTRPASAILTKTDLDLSAVLGTNEVYAGFTSATGDPYQQNDILKWYFNNEYQPIDVNNNIYLEAPSLSLTANPKDNASVSTLTATVTNSVYAPVSSVPVEFISDFGTFSESLVTTDVNGEAVAILSSTTDGNANVVAVAKGGAYQETTVGLQAMSEAEADTEAVATDKAALIDTVILGENSGIDNVISDLSLPVTGANGSDIVWDSNNTDIVANNGTVTRPTHVQGDEVVTLTATITKGAATVTKDFILTVKCLEQSEAEADAEAVAADKAELGDTAILGENSGVDNVTSDLSLPVTGANGSDIAWNSNNTDIVANNGTVTRPTYTQGDTEVTLTATITKGEATVTKGFILTVKSLVQSGAEADAEAVLADKAALIDTVILAKNTALDNITSNLTLPTSGANGSAIKWSSDNESIIKTYGVVSRPLNDEGDVVVALTAELSKGLSSDTKTFTFNVKCLNGEETVEKDQTSLSVQSFLGNNKSPYYIIQNLSLPTKGNCGSEITWKSDKTAVITNAGQVIRPSNSSKYTEVMLTATITKDSVIKTKVFKLFVMSLPDRKGPVIQSTTPSKGETNVLFDRNIEITFDEPVKKSYAFNYIKLGYYKTEKYMLFSTRTVYVPQSISAYIDTTNPNKLVIVPSKKLLTGTQYTVMIPKNAVRDNCNNIFESVDTFKFTVEPKDTRAPRIISSSPSDFSKNVPIDTSAITIQFSEPIFMGTAYNDICLRGYNGNITKTINGNTLTIALDSNLNYKTWYELNIPLTAIKDRQGNTIQPSFKWCKADITKFCTDVEHIPPKVSSTYPAPNSTGINVKQSISILFDENISASVNYEEIKLIDTAGNEIKTSKSIYKKELIIKPQEILNPDTIYTVTIPSSAVKDGVGDNLAEEYSLNYKTGSNQVNITSISPADLERYVAIYTTVEFGFGKEVAKGPNFDKIRFKNENGTSVKFNSFIQNKGLIITPMSNRVGGSRYSIYLPKGAVIDEDDNQNDVYTSHFITSYPLIMDNSTNMRVNPYGVQIKNKSVELDACELDDLFAEHDRSITEYYWEYGDGHAETGGSKVNHTYEEVGNYTIRLTVTDSKGFKVAKEQRIIIKPEPKYVDFSVTPDGLRTEIASGYNAGWYSRTPRYVKHTVNLSWEGIPQADESVELKLSYYGRQIRTTKQCTDTYGNTTFKTEINGLEPGVYHLRFCFKDKQIIRRINIVPIRHNIKLKVWLQDRNGNSTVNAGGSKVRFEVNGEKIYVPKQRDGSYLISGLSTGDNDIKVYPPYYYSSELKHLYLKEEEESVIFVVERNIPSTKPVIRRIVYHFSDLWRDSNDSDKLFIHGVNVDATFNTWVDWKGHEPGYVKFITPKGTYNERDGSKKFNMGKDIGAGGRITAMAVSVDGSMSSVVDAKVEVAPKPPLGQVRFVDGKYVLDVLYDIKDAVTPGAPEDFPLLGGSPTGLKGENYKFTGTINDKGEVNVYIGLTKAQEEEMGAKDVKEAVKLYKKIKKKKSALVGGVEVNGGVSGVLQWKYKTQGNKWAFTNGVIEVDINGSAKKRKYFLIPIIFVPGYVDGTVGLDSNTTINIKEDIQHNDYDYNMILILQPSLGAAVGAGVEKLCVEGYLQGKLDTEIRIPQDQYKVYAILSGGIRAQAAIFTWEKEALKYEWKLADTISASNKSILSEPQALMASIEGLALNSLEGECLAETRNLKSEDFSIMPRDYINEQTEWMPKEEVSQLLEAPMFASAESLSVIEPFTQSAEPEELEEIEQLEENISTQVMQSNVYPYSNQHLINTGDEMVMIWLDDNLERTSANRTQLKFSAFDGENWNQPQFINDDGTGDFEPVIAKTSNSVLMAWENINCICDDDVTLNEYISASEISVAQSVYSSPVSNWSDTITLTDDNYYDHSPSLVADENGGILVWVKDKANDMLGANPDSNDIMFSKWDGTSWSSPVVIVSNEDTIINSSAAYKDGEGVYSYTVDKDNNMQTTTDREIYVLTYNDEQWSNPVRMTDNNVEDSNPRPQYLKGEFFMTWYQEGNIVYVNDLQQEEPEIVDSLENAQVDYETAVSGNGQLSLVFAELAGTGGRDIYTLIYDSENDIWSNKIRLTDDESFNRSYSPAFTDEGKLMVAYSRVELIKEIIDGEEYVNTGSADLSMVTLTPKHDLAVYADDISLSQQNPIPGCAVTVMATISNKGEFTENNIEVEFYDGNPLDEGIKIGDTQIVAQPISARGVSDVAVDWIVPDDMSTHTLYVTVDPQNSIYDIDTQNNTASLAVVQPDIEVTALDCQNVDTTRYLVTAHVANIGSIPVNGGDISLLVGDTEGEELESTETGMLASGDERAFEFMLDSGEMNFDEGDIDIVAQFTAEEGIEEFDIDNNLYYGAIERTPLVVDKVEPSADAEEVSINQQVTVGFNMDLTQDSDFAEIVLADTDNNVVATTKEIDGANVVLTPNSDLEYGKQYFVYIPVEAVTGSQQNKMEEAYRASFTTEEYRLNPVVRFTYPGELMDETPVDAKINVIFNETVAKGSSFNDISLQDGSGKEILSRVSINDKTLLVRLESDLEDSTNYTMTIPVNAVENTRGYSIEEDFVLEFSTRADSEDDGDDGDDEDSEETGDSNGSSNNSGNSSGSTNVSGKVPIIQEQGVQGQGILSLNTPELLEKLETENENVEILVQNNQDASQVGLKIGKADVERCVTSNKGLIVNTGKVSILFSSKIMGQIAKDMGEEVTILIEKGLNQDTEAFSSYFGQAIESVYNITVNSSSNSSINLSNSSSSKVINKFAEDVMVSIKVDVSKIKDKRKVIVCVFDEETNDWKAVGGVLDLQTGKLNFNTGHFSKYSVFETNKEFDDLINRASKEQVEVLAARGIIFGKGDNKFVPDAVVTRAEFTSMAMRSLYVERTQSTGTYSDVPAGAWFTKEIETASELGLIYGTGNSLFEPNRKITREELATIACRIYTYKKGVDLPEEQGILFDDKNDISPYARQSVEFLSSKGIIFGSNNKFYPKREASREEAAVILCRLLSCVGEI